ncbi:sulfate transporter family-domain-containing protein [Massariosphaeria phaeospora]|uniref:Sulfate transporter family-domain-containing protein n=1 Tax=Massariosphaeria phaeospora TaxID=100035 RepID=A0A7C8I780_9PLEO|nr:sulfate transporter family-domain-containing protein [Massariosphaeria phaeospora]
MPARQLRRRAESNPTQQQVSLSNDSVSDAEFVTTHSDYGSSTLPRSRPIRTQELTPSIAPVSASYTHRNPIRSFAHQTSHSVTDSPQYASHGVRERTQELASYALDSETYQGRRPPSGYTDSELAAIRRDGGGTEYRERRRSADTLETEAVEEDTEPESPETVVGDFKQSEQSFFSPRAPPNPRRRPFSPGLRHFSDETTEETPLLPAPRLPRPNLHTPQNRSYTASSAKLSTVRPKGRVGETLAAGREHIVGFGRALLNPKTYTKDAAAAAAVASVQTLSAVFLGLLLNILDALSYGYILFPLGAPIFSQTGPDGISIFFLSCIVSQLCYSLGLSVFRGGVGSEMIEVVPFFHKMAYSIMARMEGQSAESIIATVIVSYCLSSIITGLIFLALGSFKLGNLVSFFPRHILIGCIGGVGFFLVVTGIEVSARLEGNLNYDLNTLHKLFAHDTVALWVLPLSLAVVIMILQRLVKSSFVLPAFFIMVFATFYLIVKGILKFDLESVRNSGWIFEKPEAGVPFYRFYSYFKFGSVDFGALATTIPTMFALSFFGIIHVPINVPALGAAVKEDNIDVNRELIAHGISNTLSGCVGSIQNYLVYANSIMFIANGGDSRLAGILLAMATTAVWIAGPAMIGFIPVCLVGSLIFLLGIDLMKEAVWDTFGKCHKLEYLTIVAIVLVMGAYDFVVGIFLGIVLACLSYVVQSSRHPAVRASYSGEVAASIVRRPRADRRYLSKVRGQIRVIKLGGFLFFGTIVSVENYMRSLMEEDSFQKQPISFMLVDLTHVADIDLSGSEGFQRINRILNRRGVKMIISGISFASKVGQALQNVGLLDVEMGDEEAPPPQVFEDLNTALEACENELLEAFYKQCRSTANKGQSTPPKSINPTKDLPSSGQDDDASSSSTSFRTNPLDPNFSSPRRGAQFLAAATTIREQGADPSSIPEGDRNASLVVPSKWRSFAQPLKIILQTFEDVSAQNEDFWHAVAPYFERKEYPAGTVLYSRGDEPNGFFILEQGRFRAEYELDQGRFYEIILPGTTCGELPFFSETDRTGTVAAEDASVAWLLTRPRFEELERKEGPAAKEFLKVGLKLTKERMDAITSYILVTAS